MEEAGEVGASPGPGIVFEAATQTPTGEQCDSPLFTQRGYCLKTAGHSSSALTNIHKMRQNDQVRRDGVARAFGGRRTEIALGVKLTW